MSSIDSALNLSPSTLPRIGFGAGPLGVCLRLRRRQDRAAAARRAYELGIRYFDVAPLYGHGRAELVLGHALGDLDRDSFLLSTKVGRYLLPPDLRDRRSDCAPRALRSIHAHRLFATVRCARSSSRCCAARRDRLVSFTTSTLTPTAPRIRPRLRSPPRCKGALPTLHELKRTGTIRAIGVGINQPPWALRWLREADVDVLMLAGRWTLLNREAEAEVFSECRRRNVAYVAAGAFNGHARPRQAERAVAQQLSSRLGSRRSRVSRGPLALGEGVNLKAARSIRAPRFAFGVLHALVIREPLPRRGR